jgi:hypothetical protein
MNLLSTVLLLPLALDGESVNNNNSAIAAISIASIAGGFLLLGALWYFVFRAKAWDKHKDGRPPRD